MGVVQATVSVLPSISDDTSTTNILLYGSEALTRTQKKEILDATLVLKTFWEVNCECYDSLFWNPVPLTL